MTNLSQYGWDDAVAAAWKSAEHSGALPGRVIADFGTSLKVAIPEVISADLSGKLAHYSSRQDAPKVGDWVAVRQFDSGRAVIEALLPRRSEIARKAPGKQTTKQIIAANVDVAFILLAVDKDFSVERLRRFLFQLSINRISPIVVLNKTDKTEELERFVSQIKQFEVPILTMVATEGKGVEELVLYIPSGKTAILLGSSGVGKSTLTNQLLGRDIQATQTVRESDDTGRHTTVHRELFVLPHGGLLIDTPGIRELQLWGTEDDLYANFDDVTKLTSQCRFTTCQHGDEDGCAVRHALKTGLLTQDKYKAFLLMKDEVSSLAKRTVAKARRTNAKSKRSLNKQNRDLMNEMRDDMMD
jgi:ribosome biogenesis GTPase